MPFHAGGSWQWAAVWPDDVGTWLDVYDDGLAGALLAYEED
jgi:hypothetical protein